VFLVNHIRNHLVSPRQTAIYVMYPTAHRNQCRSEFSVLGVDVARDNGKLELMQKVGEQVVSIVEFMVSECHRIEAKLV